ncbi:MAG: hypothetical protein QOJ61_4103 [Mycobacterium sp.]|nr:hypothetical protein [Mycobacterium sp.]
MPGLVAVFVSGRAGEMWFLASLAGDGYCSPVGFGVRPGW